METAIEFIVILLSLLLFVIGAIFLVRYNPESEDVRINFDLDEIAKSIALNTPGDAGKERRQQIYAFDFIKSKNMQKDFDEYCDAMELMRTLQIPEED